MAVYGGFAPLKGLDTKPKSRLEEQQRDARCVFALGERLGLYDATHTESLELQLERAADGHRIEGLVSRMLPGIQGQAVRLTGLVAREDLNGRCGLTGIISSGRVAVTLDGGEPALLVKVANIESAVSKEGVLAHAMAALRKWQGTALRGLTEATMWAESTEEGHDPEGGLVAVIRGVLSKGDVARLQDSARACGEQSDRSGTYASKRSVPELDAELIGPPHDVRFSREHIALYLHRDGYVQRELPEMWAKMLQAMREQPGEWYEWDEDEPLQVRCIELHSYTVGGGLVQVGHRDHGSILTMSVLLSDPAGVSGGQFVTYDQRKPVAYASLKQGDAVLLHSRRAHNVAQVTRGIRQSLVIELWRKKTNEFDRER